MASTGVLVPPPPEIQGESSDNWTYEVFHYQALLDTQGERLLPGLWKRLKDENIFDVFFHDYPDMTFASFVQAMTQQNEILLMVVRRKGETMEHVGMVVVAQPLFSEQVKRGIGGFLFFKDYWNHRDADAAARKALEYIFGTLQFDTFVGTTPKGNRAALGFIHRLGFKSIGEIPHFHIYKGQAADSVVSYMTREMFMGAPNGQG